MIFHYIAKQQDGKTVEGDFEGQGLAEALQFLATRSLKPISVKALKGGRPLKRQIFGVGINTTDKVFLTKYLSLMLKSGIDLFSAIDILIADFDKPGVRAFLGEVRTNLEQGKPFYSAFAKYPNIFEPVFVNLVKSGEASGNLDNVFEDLTKFLKRQQDLKNRVRGALIYPVILLVLSFLILILLVSFALPKIAGVFTGAGFELPAFPKLVFGIGAFLNQFLWYLFILFIGGGIGLVYIFKKVPGFRLFILNIVMRIPVVSRVVEKIALQRFASTLASLIKSGLPITEALEVTAGAVGNEGFRKSLLRIAREGLASGLTIGEAFRRETVFPVVISNLIAISEKTGHMESVLGTLSDFYESEIDTSLKNLVSFLEPVLLLFMGLMIGGIALSIIVPIYQLITQF